MSRSEAVAFCLFRILCKKYFFSLEPELLPVLHFNKLSTMKFLPNPLQHLVNELSWDNFPCHPAQPIYSSSNQLSAGDHLIAFPSTSTLSTTLGTTFERCAWVGRLYYIKLDDAHPYQNTLSSFTNTRLPSIQKMALTTSSWSVNVQDKTVGITVANDDVARLMYYLNCVTSELNLHILDNDLLAHENYKNLSATRVATVFQTALELKPDLLIGKLIFSDEQHEVIPKQFNNAFVSITAACQYASVQRNVFLAGQTQNVTDVMFFNNAWLNKNYYHPINNISNAIRGREHWHCDHCNGTSGTCACRVCLRSSRSVCTEPSPWWAYLLVIVGGFLIMNIFWRGLKSYFV